MADESIKILPILDQILDVLKKIDGPKGPSSVIPGDGSTIEREEQSKAEQQKAQQDFSKIFGETIQIGKFEDPKHWENISDIFVNKIKAILPTKIELFYRPAQWENIATIFAEKFQVIKPKKFKGLRSTFENITSSRSEARLGYSGSGTTPSSSVFTSIVKSGIIGAAALFGIIEAVKYIADVLPKYADIDWKKTAIGLGLAAGAVGGLALLAKKLGKHIKDNKFESIAGAAALYGIIETIDYLSEILPKYASIDWKASGASLVVAEGAIAGLGAIAVALGKVIEKNPVASAAGGAAVWGLIYLLDDLADAMMGYTKFDWKSVKSGMEAAGVAITAMGTAVGVLGALITQTGGVGAIIAGAGAGAVWVLLELVGYTATKLKELSTVDGKKLQDLSEPLKRVGEGLSSVMSLEGASAGVLNAFSSILNSDPISFIKKLQDLDIEKLSAISKVFPTFGNAVKQLIEGFAPLKDGIPGIKEFFNILKQELIQFGDVVDKFDTKKLDKLQDFLSSKKTIDVNVGVGLTDSLNQVNQTLNSQLKLQAEQTSLTRELVDVVRKLPQSSSSTENNTFISPGNSTRSLQTNPYRGSHELFESSPYYV